MNNGNNISQQEKLSKIAFAIMLFIGIATFGLLIASLLYISIESLWAEISAGLVTAIFIVIGVWQGKSSLKTDLSIGNMKGVYSCNYEIGSNL